MNVYFSFRTSLCTLENWWKLVLIATLKSATICEYWVAIKKEYFSGVKNKIDKEYEIYWWKEKQSKEKREKNVAQNQKRTVEYRIFL